MNVVPLGLNCLQVTLIQLMKNSDSLIFTIANFWIFPLISPIVSEDSPAMESFTTEM